MYMQQMGSMTITEAYNVHIENGWTMTEINELWSIEHENGKTLEQFQSSIISAAEYFKSL
jgi:hypothetical protein